MSIPAPKSREVGTMSPSMSMEHAKRHCAAVSGISDVAYDALAILVNKLQGIAAMEEYKLDAREAEDDEFLALLGELEQRECKDIVKLKGLVISKLKGLVIS